MEPLKRYYEILGVQPASSLQEINQAYINLLNKLHPYRLSNDPRLQQKAQAMAREINEAYAAIKKRFSSPSEQFSSPEDHDTVNLPAERPLPSPILIKAISDNTTARKSAAGSPTASKLIIVRPETRNEPPTKPLSGRKPARGLLLALLSIPVIFFAVKVIAPAPAARQVSTSPPHEPAPTARQDTAPPQLKPKPTARQNAAPPSQKQRPAARPDAAPPPSKPAPAARQSAKQENAFKHDASRTVAVEQGADRATSHATAVRRAAERGDSVAQVRLAYLYLTGKGVPQDFGEAAKWNRKAAEKGHAAAQDWLGYLYETGKGVQQDFGEAATWYRRAAEQGESEAQRHLALLHAQGKGVAKDMAEALKWCRKAAGQGNPEAQRTLEMWTGQ